MHIKSLKMISLTFILGIFGAFVRWVHIMTAFEKDTGLAIPHSTSSYFLIVFTVAGAAAIYLMLRKYKTMNTDDSFTGAFATKGVVVSGLAVLFCALVAIGGVITALKSATAVDRSVFELVTGIFALLCAVSLLSLIGTARNGGQGKLVGFNFTIVVLFLCFWLISAYKYNAADPVLWNFANRIFAISAILLAFYFMAGFGFSRPRPFITLYFSLLGAFLGMITFADNLPIGETIIMAGLVFVLLLLSYALSSNMRVKESAVQSTEDNTAEGTLSPTEE